MNSNTKILEELLTIKNNIDNTHTITSDGYFTLESLIAMVQENIREETAKSNGKANAYKVVTKLLNKFRTKVSGTHSIINSYPYETDTAQYVCDGYRLFKFTEFLPLEKCPDTLIKHYDYQPMNLEKIFKNNTIGRTCKEILNKPTLAELKLYIKLKKMENKANKKNDNIIFDFGDKLPAVNAEFLLDVYQALGNDFNIYCGENQPETTPLWIKSDDGETEAILMPVKK